MRSDRECDWVNHGNKSYALVSDVSPNIQVYTNREQAREKQNE